MKKVLVVNTAGLGRGGITTHMLNYISCMQRKAVFDIVQTIYDDNDLVEDFKRIGCHIIRLPHRKKHVLSYVVKLWKVLKYGGYDVIHVHGNSSTMAIELNIAKQLGVPIRITHNHNTICEHPKINKFLHKVLLRSYTNALACSNEAGTWLFGVNNFSVLRNAIEVKKYQYNPKTAQEYLRKLDCDEHTLLVAQIGNLNEQKNPFFMLDVLNLLKDKKIIFIYVGDGPLADGVDKMITKHGLSDRVHMLGLRKDIDKLLQAIDVLVLPSLWEGLPLITIESQAAGTKLIISDKVSPLAILNKDSCYQLELSFEKWAECLQSLSINRSYKERYIGYECVVNAGYDIADNINLLRKIYGI